MPDYRFSSKEKEEQDDYRRNASKIWRRPTQSHPIPIRNDVESARFVETEERPENGTLMDIEMVSPFALRRATAGEARLADLTWEDNSNVNGQQNSAGDFRIRPDSSPPTTRSDLETSACFQSACGRDVSMVTCGFQHCAAEAVRYLIEEEHLSPSDPLVVGLQQHLSMRERHLDPERVLDDYVAAQRLLLSSVHNGLWDDDDDTTGHSCESNDEDCDHEEYSDESEMEESSNCYLVQSLADLTSAYLLEMCQAAHNGSKTNSRLPTVLPPVAGSPLSSSPTSSHYCPDFLPVNDRPVVTSPSPSI